MNHHETILLAEQHRAELIDDALTRSRPRSRPGWLRRRRALRRSTG